MLHPFFFIIQVSDGKYFDRNGTKTKMKLKINPSVLVKRKSFSKQNRK